jgi:PAS domain-containing protein
VTQGQQQHPVEIIMARGLMANLTTPAFLVDRDGNLVFFNDAAGAMLGLSFEEAGPMGPADLVKRFTPTHPDGSPLPLQELPLTIAVTQGRPVHDLMFFRSADGANVHSIEVTCFPIVGRSGPQGALAIFWDREA